ncbi:MAG: 50S ribosomal protein L18 [Thermoplasmata archaeon]|nr:50S ribosomal protein L18 [Thermoplasmata archaeon]
MAHGPRYRIPFRRRLEKRTNYKKRRALLLSYKTRMVVRRSSKYVQVQFIDYDVQGDKVVTTAYSRELTKYGWSGSGKSIPAAYLTGYLAGKRALDSGVTAAVLDLGLAISHPNGRLLSALKGASEAGVDVPHDPKVLPSDERVSGKHIDDKTPDLIQKVKAQIDTLKEA